VQSVSKRIMAIFASLPLLVDTMVMAASKSSCGCGTPLYLNIYDDQHQSLSRRIVEAKIRSASYPGATTHFGAVLFMTRRIRLSTKLPAFLPWLRA
jgi:hypothetical protein